MALVRCITEMGMGVDVHGKDYTTAAKRAVFDAIHHSSLGFQRMLGKTADDMRVDVTVGVPNPAAVGHRRGGFGLAPRQRILQRGCRRVGSAQRGWGRRHRNRQCRRHSGASTTASRESDSQDTKSPGTAWAFFIGGALADIIGAFRPSV